MSLFVTDGEQRPTLAVVRALGSAGIPVTVGAENSNCLAGESRYCSAVLPYPSPLKDPQRFQTFFQDQILDGRYRVVLPMTDVTVQLVAPLLANLSRSEKVPLPNQETVNRVQDKREVLNLAAQVGIMGPECFEIAEREELDAFAQRISFPVVIKPRFSRYRRKGEWAIGSVAFARDASDFIAKYREARAQIPDPLVQEVIQGAGQGVFLLVWDGEVKAAFCHRRLREKPPWGGVSVYSESIAMNEELVHQSACLLKALGWQGVAMVEYKMDRRDGSPKLMEVNGRFWGSLQLSIDAGMNFPLLLYKHALGENVPPQFDYRVGVRSRWLLGDLDHLWIRLTESSAMASLMPGLPSKWSAIVNFLRWNDSNVHNEVWRRDDRGPGQFECKSYFGDAARRLFHRSEAQNAH